MSEAPAAVKRAPGRPMIGEAPSVIVTVRLPPSMKAEVAARAKADRQNRNQVIRAALRAYLDGK